MSDAPVLKYWDSVSDPLKEHYMLVITKPHLQLIDDIP